MDTDTGAAATAGMRQQKILSFVRSVAIGFHVIDRGMGLNSGRKAKLYKIILVALQCFSVTAAVAGSVIYANNVRASQVETKGAGFYLDDDP